MSPERQYSEKEIAAIFKQAAADQESAYRQRPHSGGLTLAEIEQIGEEVGITPEFIARAAATLDRTTSTLPPTTFLGFPISVGRTVDLPGSFSDEDWDRLVVDLRETFQEPGEIRRDGSLRQWRVGNLHALIEPTESGHRLRLRTLNQTLQGGLLSGLAFLMMGLFFMLLVAVKGGFALNPKMLFVSMFALVGLGSMGFSAYRLPRWRKERERQMEAIAARAAERAGAQRTKATREAAPSHPLDLDLPTDSAEAKQPRTQRRTRS